MKPLARPFPQRRTEPEARGSADAPPQAEFGRFPAVRMRRNRKAAWSRRLVAENVLTPADLIWPMFVTEGRASASPSNPCPGVDRISVDLVAKAAEEAVALGIPVDRALPLHGRQAAHRGRARSLQPRQSRLPRHPRRAQGGPRHRRPARRGARPLHQPRPRRADARAARSSTTRRSTRSCARRWCRRKPAATSSRPPT